MHYKYTLTDEFLNNFSEFYRLHGALYAMGDNLPWQKELEQIAGDRAALAAVSLDTDYDNERFLANPLTVEIPAGLKQDFLNYRKTKDKLEQYFGSNESINTLSIELFHHIHQSILGQTYHPAMDLLRSTDRLLPKTIFENGVYKKVEVVVKTPPNQIRARIDELNNWIKANYKTLNPVIKAAILYFFLAKIHPYTDGNGRTAKVFIHGILLQNKVDTRNLIVIEEYYLRNRGQYFDILAKAIETNELTEWLEFFSAALLYGALEACKILYKLSGGCVDILNSKIVLLTPNQRQVINALQASPRSSGAEIGRALNFSRQYINNLLQELIQMGVVNKRGTGRGSTYTLATYGSNS